MKKVLDLFCGAGGSAKGLQQAGLYVVGVDIALQPNYCGDEFIQADALTFDLEGYDAFWASPPCQCYSCASIRWRNKGKKYPDLVAKVRKKLMAIGKTYVIEGVVGTPLNNPTYLEGTMFGLGVIRRRLFESNVWIPQPSYITPKGKVQDGYYVTVVGAGGNSNNHNYRYLNGLPKNTSKIDTWSYAMGIDWMTIRELTQAVPPAYAKYIGRFII